MRSFRLDAHGHNRYIKCSPFSLYAPIDDREEIELLTITRAMATFIAPSITIANPSGKDSSPIPTKS